MKQELHDLMIDFVDYLLPSLTPYETSLYLYLLRHSVLGNGSQSIRIGKRTMADGYGTGSRGAKTNYKHMTTLIKGLEEKGCLTIGDSTKDGTLYTVVLPRNIPMVKERIAALVPSADDKNFFSDPQKRLVIFERDKWICQYCGEKVTEENVTLDHYVPQCKGGGHSKDNLRMSCLACNSIKSGKSYEEAAPFILKSIQERKQRSQK